MSRLPRSARAGFSLVEVLLVLLIMGMLMVSMTQILTAARYSRDTIHNVQETQLAGPAILDLIERDLRGIFVYDRPSHSHLRVRDRVLIGLDGDSLDFVTTTDSLTAIELERRFVRADVNEVGYRLRPSPTSDEFLEIWRREQVGIDDDPYEGGEFVYLHDRVKGFDVKLFAFDGTEENEPLDEWGPESREEHLGLPARIEITLVLELQPRIQREQLRIVPLDRRTVVYRRVLRFPEALRGEEDDLPVPTVPAPEQGGPAGLTDGPPGQGRPDGQDGPDGGPEGSPDQGQTQAIEDAFGDE
jgi:prepilin-type N-terminal cleavage/methylation domain-containing protein